MCTGRAEDPLSVTLVRKHEELLTELFTRCETHKVALALSKAQIMSAEVSILGSLVKPGRSIEIDPGRVRDITAMPPPANLPEMERSFGALAYVASHVPRFAF